jgi:hypothetical protein
VIPHSLTPNTTYNYKLIVNPSAARIRLLINGVEAWACVDGGGWDAPNASYFSISKSYDMIFCNIQSTTTISEKINTCFIPYPFATYFQSYWQIDSTITGLVFDAYGRDIYIKLSNQPDDSSYQYWVVIAGWDGSTSKVFRSDGSVICENHHQVDLYKMNSYFLYIQPYGNVGLVVNGNYAWVCPSNNYDTPIANYFGFSRYTNSIVEICNIGITKYQ